MHSCRQNKQLARIALYLGLMAAAASSGQPWRTPSMPVEEIRPGMRGIGKTVFYGDHVEEFGIEVIDIMKNYYPQHDIIIVRLTGEKAERMGVVAGMSGSPVYIDGSPNVVMAGATVAIAGSSFPHNNMQPYLTLNFCIAMQGIFPQRP